MKQFNKVSDFSISDPSLEPNSEDIQKHQKLQVESFLVIFFDEAVSSENIRMFVKINRFQLNHKKMEYHHITENTLEDYKKCLETKHNHMFS